MIRSPRRASQCLCPLLTYYRWGSSKHGRDRLISPMDLTEDHVSSVYCVSKEEIRGMFPTSLPRCFAAEVEVLGQACWLLRKQSYDIIQELRKFEISRAPRTRYLLYGRDGSGKTIALHQVLHYCVKAGWVVVFVPGVFSWTHSPHELHPSPRLPGTYDQPEAASLWLKTFRTLNSHSTAQMRLSQDWVWGKKEHSSAGEELNKVIEKGLVKPALATGIVSALLEELVMASDRFKMILAVDEFNGCFSSTSLKIADSRRAKTSELNLIRSLLHHLPKFPGAVLLSLSRWQRPASGWLPHELLRDGEGSRAVLKSCRAVEVPPYNKKEMETFLSYYAERRWVNRELTAPVLNELWHLTSGSPSLLQKLCSSL